MPYLFRSSIHGKEYRIWVLENMFRIWSARVYTIDLMYDIQLFARQRRLKSNLPKDPPSSSNTSPILAIAPGSFTSTQYASSSSTETEEFVTLGQKRMTACMAVGWMAMVAFAYQEMMAKPPPIGRAKRVTQASIHEKTRSVNQ